MSAALPGSLAFVDLETTGCDPARDRIIEIAVIAVDDDRVVDEWSTLLDPGVPIARTIEGLTGIDDSMVADAPTFTSLRDEIHERLRGRTLVAHNARFDYGFLRNAFRREGIAFRVPVACTLRLARSLFPRLRRHGLDHLIEHFGLACDARHRALGDARATLAFVHAGAAELGADAVAEALARQRGGPALPPGMAPDALAELPSAPGVYLFYGTDHTLLYVGKSTDLHRRVSSHFSGDHRTRRATELAQSTRRVEWIETAGELGALLREAALVKQRRPLHNRRLGPARDQVIVTLAEGPDGWIEPDIVSARHPEAWSGDRWYGPFGNRRAARRFLRALADERGLCPRRLGLERGRATGPCFQRQLGRCTGACCGDEPPLRFNLRLVEGAAPRRIDPWPWNGPVVIPERDPFGGREELHVVDGWRYLGTAREPDELATIAASREAVPFDRDQYRLLRRWIERHPNVPQPLATHPQAGTVRRGEAATS